MQQDDDANDKGEPAPEPEPEPESGCQSQSQSQRKGSRKEREYVEVNDFENHSQCQMKSAKSAKDEILNDLQSDAYVSVSVCVGVCG